VRFRDRPHAGRFLADRLEPLAGTPGLRVLALPRGGVPVAWEVAERLRAPLDVFVVRKLGLPTQPELAMGAIATGGVTVLNRDLVDKLALPAELVDSVAREEQVELERRERLYRRDRPPVGIAGKTVILIDDGLATGATMRAAVQAVRRQGPARVIVAVPVGAPSTCDELAREVDEIVCILKPEIFEAIGLWYDDFSQTTDGEVRAYLDAAERRPEQAA
jgi:putative phosphoribosyl transferase